MRCNWGVCQACWDRAEQHYEANRLSIPDMLREKAAATMSGGGGSGAAQGGGGGGGKGEGSRRPIIAHFGTIQLLNHFLIHALPFIDLRQQTTSTSSTGGVSATTTTAAAAAAADSAGAAAAAAASPSIASLSELLRALRGLVLEDVKLEPFTKALAATNQTGNSSRSLDLLISRSRARKHQQAGMTDSEGRWSVFGQAFRALHGRPPSVLRRANQIYNTKFMGEHAIDVGGPYRETFVMYTQELQSGTLPLLVHTPNGRQAVGYNRDKWLLNPGATSATQLQMFAFLGKLMGVAIRSKEYLALSLPSIIWKLLVDDRPTREDLEGVDFSVAQSLDMLRNVDFTGMMGGGGGGGGGGQGSMTPQEQQQKAAELFASTFFVSYTTTSSDDRMVELVPNGENIDVTFETRQHYCDLVMNYRLHEFDLQAAAVRAGLATVVPLSLLSLVGWSQLEHMVCGSPEIDVALLERMTDYSSCRKTDTHIQYFWQVLREFNQEERAALLKFTWGRTRLPLTAADFPQRFKLQSFHRSPPDAYYPAAHTCFFSLELPRYSSLEIMREKLRYAIFNCEAIDGDDESSGMAVAAMGWEE